MGVMNIDKAEVACRFGRSIESYEEHAAVQREIAAHLAELATAYVTQPPPARFWKWAVVPAC